MIREHRIALLATLLAAAAGAGVEYHLSHPAARPSPATAQAPVTLPQLDLHDLDGRPVRLPDAHAGKPLLLNFWASWCGPCLQFAPVFQEIALELEPRIRFVKLDTEQEAAIASRYAIRSIPTLMIFRGGQILAQRSGSLPKSLFKEWLLSTAAAPK